MTRAEIHDWMMGAVFEAWRKEGINTEKVEKIYERQRIVIEAEDIARGEFDGYKQT
jgi:hypothetical protein